MLDPQHAKSCHVGAPACWALELACKEINEAFGDGHCYLVGSALDKSDWRDIDVRLILPDDEFDVWFPGTRAHRTWELDTRWLILTSAISAWLAQRTGLPVDFQFQPRTHANERHDKARHALGMRLSSETPP